MVEDSKTDNLYWWWERVRSEDDWNTLKPQAKKDLINKINQCMADLLGVGITKNEILELIEASDVPTV